MTAGDRVLVRTYAAGVYIGTIEKREGQEVTLTSARRMWRWAGAAECGELARRGPSKPAQCKFPAVIDSVLLFQAVEIIPVSPEADAAISAVKVWSE